MDSGILAASALLTQEASNLLVTPTADQLVGQTLTPIVNILI